MSAPVLLSIGTTHPWNIAGVGLDARVAAEYGVAHAVCVVAVSAQDARGLHALQPVDRETVRAQLGAAPPHIGAIRVGALVSSGAAGEVATYCEDAGAIPIVVDPVMQASLGGSLTADERLPLAMADGLLTLPVVVTPNLEEAARLLGFAVTDGDGQRAAAKFFVARGARAALVKGGHLEGDPVDVLADGAGVRSFTAARLPGAMRGTGCTLAAALACELLLGRAIDDAVMRAREYVRAKISANTVRGGLQVAF